VLWQATVRDISLTGLGLVLKRRFERGTGLAIEIPAKGDYPGDTLLAKVAHTTALAGGNWLLGCAFVSELSDDALVRLLQLAQAPSKTEGPPGTPAGQAKPGPDKNVLVSGIRLAGTNHRGREASVPVNRLFLNVAWPLQPGTILKVRVANDPKKYPPVFLRITSCTLDDGRWTLRYTFAQKPAREMMHLLGHLVSGEWKL
jgi:hypothetical protein